MHQHRTIFDDVLRQIDADFPEERHKPQAGDTYAMRANAAKESSVRLVRHACQRLLAALEKAGPTRLAQVQTQLDEQALFGAPDEPSAYHLKPAERAARLQATILAALECAHLIRATLEQPAPLPQAARAPIVQWLEYLDKIITDEVTLTTDETGTIIKVTKRTTKKKGAYRLGSATDPGSTFRIHGEDKKDLGYNVNLATTDNFVREIRADTGAQPDAVGIPDLIQAQKDHHDVVPPKLIYDSAAGTGKTHAKVAEASDEQTQLVAPLIDHDKHVERFSPQDFQLSEDGTALTCPNGQTSSVAYNSGSGDGRNFRFLADQCAACSLWEQCRTQKRGSKALRQVFISDYRSEFEAALAYSQTPDFKVDMKLRSQAERVIAGIVRYNGGRRARRRGQDKADFQAKMNATAYNIKRWIRLLTLKSRPAKVPA